MKSDNDISALEEPARPRNRFVKVSCGMYYRHDEMYLSWSATIIYIRQSERNSIARYTSENLCCECKLLTYLIIRI